MEFKIFGYTMRLEVIIICVLLANVIAIMTWCSCAGGVKEGYHAAAHIAKGTLGYSQGGAAAASDFNNWLWDTTPQDIYSSLKGNVGGPVPLPEGEMVLFAQNKISPECCPSVYSSSTGCVCASPAQMRYLNERGGNHTYGD